MLRPRVLGSFLLLAAMAGCQSGTQIVDPFLGTATVPPPGTVQFPQSGGAQPYYQGAPVAAPVGRPAPPPSYAPPPAATQPPVKAYTFPQSSTGRQGAQPASKVAFAQRSPPIRVVEPRRDDSVRLASAQGASSQPPTGSAARTAREGAGADAVPGATTSFKPAPGRTELADLPTRSGTARPATVRLTGSRYGYDPQYRWLRGRLEFRKSDGQWKLRYIPIDGKTDAYGGSVIVENPAALANLQPGDYVDVAGRISGNSDGGASFSPPYEVAQVTAGMR